MLKKIKFQYLIIVFALFCFSTSINAQCAMCRAALGGEENVVQAQAVNDGIVYLMVIPYLLVGAIGYAVYLLYKNKKA
jgi:hypothetical protein